MNYTTEMQRFKLYMTAEEKSRATMEKYLRDVRCFSNFLMNRPLEKEETIAYKEYLISKYALASVNSMLVALNCFLRFIGKQGCCVKPLRVQRQIFSREDKELSVGEYQRLVKAAKNTRLSLIPQTMKALCDQADISPEKVYPHNLWHLFARTFYGLEKDIVRLADMLGHSSIDTTRIYTMETGV